MNNVCESCEHNRPEGVVARCGKGRGGIFRLAVMCNAEDCPDYERLSSITEIRVQAIEEEGE